MTTLAERIILLNRSLDFTSALPKGIRVMNPFRENQVARNTSELFYKKYYNDNKKRTLILGINPGRLGAGATGIPFTDTKRLEEKCALKIDGIHTHEPSSVFVYEVIDAYGGVDKFYSRFYINSVCPLGFTSINEKGKEVNFNYYDRADLIEITRNFIVESIHKQLELGMNTEVCICLGKRNAEFLKTMNDQHHFFKRIVALEHPRYVMQYKSKSKEKYIAAYLEVLAAV